MISSVAQGVFSLCRPPLKEGWCTATLKTAECGIGIAIIVIGTLGFFSVFTFHPALSYSLMGLGGAWTAANLLGIIIIGIATHCRSKAPPEELKNKYSLLTDSGSEEEEVKDSTQSSSSEEEKVSEEEEVKDSTQSSSAEEEKVSEEEEVKDSTQSSSAEEEEVIPSISTKQVEGPAAVIMPKAAPVKRDCKPLFNKAKAYIEQSVTEDLVEDVHRARAALLADFQLVLDHDEVGGYEQMEKMLAALPYYLGLKDCKESEFKPIGTPNLWGNDCFLNAALQCLTHTRYADYLLYRPIPDTLPPPDIEEPLEPNCVKPKVPTIPTLSHFPKHLIDDLQSELHNESSFSNLRYYLTVYAANPNDSSLSGLNKKMKILENYNHIPCITKFKAEIESYIEAVKTNKSKENEYWKRNYSYTQEMRKHKSASEGLVKMRETQTLYRTLVEKLRGGTPLTKEDKAKLEDQCQIGGDHSAILREVSTLAPELVDPDQYYVGDTGITIGGINCTKDKLDGGILDRPWSLLILGSGQHYQVLVKYKGKMYQISDSWKREVRKSNDDIIRDARDRNKQLQPYFPTLVFPQKRRY